MKAYNIENLLTFNAKDFKCYSNVKGVEPNEVKWRIRLNHLLQHLLHSNDRSRHPLQKTTRRTAVDKSTNDVDEKLIVF